MNGAMLAMDPRLLNLTPMLNLKVGLDKLRDKWVFFRMRKTNKQKKAHPLLYFYLAKSRGLSIWLLCMYISRYTKRNTALKSAKRRRNISWGFPRCAWNISTASPVFFLWSMLLCVYIHMYVLDMASPLYWFVVRKQIVRSAANYRAEKILELWNASMGNIPWLSKDVYGGDRGVFLFLTTFDYTYFLSL